MKIVKRWTTHPSLRRARTTHPPSVGYAKRRGRAQIEHLGPFGYFRLPMLVDLAIEQMKLVFEPLPVGIDHTLEVLGFVRAIARGEAIEGNTLLIAELAAVLHDIGAVKALQVHGSIEGKFQELEGPPIAREILCSLSCEGSLVDRVSFLSLATITPFQPLTETISSSFGTLTASPPSAMKDWLHLSIP